MENATLVVPVLTTLIRIRGTNAGPAASARAKEDAAANITLRGLNFRDARRTFLEKWSVPSGGDWALYDGGAIELRSAEDCSIELCRLTLVERVFF